ncbi:MAG: hypothetical protein M3O50_22190, partial [Myxococcota bacterium]|nr:hypothetical protein [Myxococcota bacterium]
MGTAVDEAATAAAREVASVRGGTVGGATTLRPSTRRTKSDGRGASIDTVGACASPSDETDGGSMGARATDGNSAGATGAGAFPWERELDALRANAKPIATSALVASTKTRELARAQTRAR